MFSKLMTAAAVATLAATPVMAAVPTSSAAKLSLSRASTKGKKSSEFAPAVIIGVIATVAIVGGAIALADNDDNPDSP